MTDNKILILEGGFNEEHEVSLETGIQIKKSLKNLGIKFDSIIVNPKNFEKIIKSYSLEYICFNALHGPFGEDGKIQKILDKYGFKYTHANANSSHIAFNKIKTKNEVINISVPTPYFKTLRFKELNKQALTNLYQKIGPYVIKPNSSGSSYGVKIIKNEDSINYFLKEIKNNINIYKNHKELLIEKYIPGRELTVAVLNNDHKSVPIEVTEIIFKNDFFDYESKYTKGYSKHILPANIPKNIYDSCKLYAKMIHDKINCGAISRSDFIYDDKQIYFLEINTQPGLTPLSLVPEQLKYQNIGFDKLILNIIKSVK